MPSLAASAISNTYWSRGEDLDTKYSSVFIQNVNLMLARCLRRWLNINPNLTHVSSRVCCLSHFRGNSGPDIVLLNARPVSLIVALY